MFIIYCLWGYYSRVPNSVLGNKVRSYPYELFEYLIRGKVHIKHQLSSFVDNDKYFFKRSHKVNFLSFLLPVSPLQSSVWLCTEYMYSTVYLHILKQNIFFLPFSCIVKLIHFKANIWHSGFWWRQKLVELGTCDNFRDNLTLF